eukprot:TRINITY_DN725_c1_g2_i1.p1 TRINITY_DN725_c1_g2~~TRINITY_DN725_c1_g2_i1.p1  ORF type:complete len:903 (-),score=225.84 TRINITY_DN725_c1_g2_i1:8-2644(-)
MSYNLDFISLGVNRVAGCIDWVNDQIIYGGGNFISLYSFSDGRITNTLVGHSGRINGVKWIRSNVPEKINESNEIVSASSDGSLRVWKRSTTVAGEWDCIAVLADHKQSVTCLDCVTADDGSVWVVSCSGDMTVKIWNRPANVKIEPPTGDGPGMAGWSLVQTLDVWKPKMVECVAISLLPGLGVPIVAAGAVDSRIHVFVYNDGKFNKVVSLQGHEDWLRCLSFASFGGEHPYLMLASGGQDKRIRLWKVTQLGSNEAPPNTETGVHFLDQLAAKMAKEGDNIDISQILAHHQSDHVINIKSTTVTDGKEESSNVRFNIVLESVLIGHDEWVHSVRWAPKELKEGGSAVQPQRLISSSMDKTIVIWEPESISGVWIDKVRVGEVGGNTLGFFGACLGPNSEHMIGHGYSGSLHLWKKKKQEDEDPDLPGVWEPIITVAGHFDEVRDIAWEPNGDYLVSVGKDQTTRVWGQWKRPEHYYSTPTKESWNEIARPQVHGHDINCLSFVKGVHHRIVSGADEKILRVFDAPQTFLDTFENVTKIKYSDIPKIKEGRPLSANVPPLGLSNKPFYDNEKDDLVPEDDISAFMGGDEEDAFENIPVKPHAPLVLAVPPLEEQLIQRTLWAEIQKLYGHGNELYTVTCNNSGTLLASSCKAQMNAEQAAIRLWDTKTWKTKLTLQLHSSTVTQLAFSNDDQYLLSVSRARTVSVFKLLPQEDDSLKVELIGKSTGHGRMVWSCSWSFDDKVFVTGSRDVNAANVKFWTILSDPSPTSIKALAALQFKSSVTAVSFAPVPVDKGYLCAIGLEDGSISLWYSPVINQGKLEWKNYLNLDKKHCHVNKVKKLCWRKQSSSSPSDELQLASCSVDHSIRIFTIKIKNSV